MIGSGLAIEHLVLLEYLDQIVLLINAVSAILQLLDPESKTESSKLKHDTVLLVQSLHSHSAYVGVAAVSMLPT